MAISRSMKCNKCGYELLGLGNRGQCPECGEPFNKELRQGVTDASDPNQSDRMLRRVRTILLAVLAVVIMGCGGFFHIRDPQGRALAMGLVFGAFAALGAVTSYFYEKDE